MTEHLLNKDLHVTTADRRLSAHSLPVMLTTNISTFTFSHSQIFILYIDFFSNRVYVCVCVIDQCTLTGLSIVSYVQIETLNTWHEIRFLRVLLFTSALNECQWNYECSSYKRGILKLQKSEALISYIHIHMHMRIHTYIYIIVSVYGMCTSCS